MQPEGVQHIERRPAGRRRLGRTLRLLALLLPAALLFLGLEPWGLQASYRPDDRALSFETELSLVAVGDIMMHLSQIEAARDPKSKAYDFTPQFAALQQAIASADIAIGNLETTFTPGKDPAGYPRFNAPPELARDLAKTGFDLLVTANNHSLDNGAKGLLGTLDALEKNGLQAVGTRRSAAAVNEPVLIEKKGIKVAFVAYATTTNGLPLPKDRPYLLSLYSPQAVQRDVAAARRAGADLIVGYIHFGAEYERYPNPAQYTIAAALRAAGVHVVLGSHPHVIQPEHRRLHAKQYTLFSLGNFISGQRGKFKDIGLLTRLRIVKQHPAGITRIEAVEHTPTYVSRSSKKGKAAYSVVPLSQVDPLLSKRYREHLTYNRTSLQRDLLGHIRGGVYFESSGPQAPEVKDVAQTR